ncbi:MAG: ABC transporter permease [Planctomycetota bacterium]|nr:MAG: ABC transporter permease [Planctomycetota bacterium]
MESTPTRRPWHGLHLYCGHWPGPCRGSSASLSGSTHAAGTPSAQCWSSSMTAWMELAVRNTLRSPLRSLQLILVVLLITGLVCAAAGIHHALGRGLQQAGSEQVALVMSLSSEGSPERSLLSPQALSAVAALPGLSQQRDGSPLIAAEVVHHAGFATATSSPRQVVVRGIDPATWALLPGARLITGRMPQHGEVLVGSHAAAAIGVSPATMAVGAEITLDGEVFLVSGHFRAQGHLEGSEVWMPRDAALALTRRDGPSILRVDSGEAAGAVDLLSLRRADLELMVLSEADYLRDLSAVHRPLRSIAVAAAVLALVAALVGATTTVAAALAGRSCEFACLRAIGVSSRTLLGLVFAEHFLLATFGGALGIVLALLLLDQWQLPLASGTLPLAVDGWALAWGAICGLALIPFIATALSLPLLARPLPESLRSS